mmetsp:Transcript_65725/g.189121  ORF Transcript_65725/g.189121 Transcript_65725/m.189121 type:complete len:318 (+) Transcript_65725:161-1114(+)
MPLRHCLPAARAWVGRRWMHRRRFRREAKPSSGRKVTRHPLLQRTWKGAIQEREIALQQPTSRSRKLMPPSLQLMQGRQHHRAVTTAESSATNSAILIVAGKTVAATVVVEVVATAIGETAVATGITTAVVAVAVVVATGIVTGDEIMIAAVIGTATLVATAGEETVTTAGTATVSEAETTEAMVIAIATEVGTTRVTTEAGVSAIVAEMTEATGTIAGTIEVATTGGEMTAGRTMAVVVVLAEKLLQSPHRLVTTPMPKRGGGRSGTAVATACPRTCQIGSVTSSRYRSPRCCHQSPPSAPGSGRSRFRRTWLARS